MLSNPELLFLVRLGERLIGVFIAGICIFLGYRLFIKLPEKTDSQGRVVLPGGINIWLSRVGPGIFFALFGALIVGLSFKSAVDIKAPHSIVSGPQADATQNREAMELHGMASNAAGQEQRIAEARTQIFTLNHDLPRALRPELHGKDREILDIASDYSKVQILRALWLDRWGSFDEFEKWVMNGAKRPAPATVHEPAEIFLAGKAE